jgi:hypothetical protein
MEKQVFTMKDVHACLPWISSTTLFDRIKSRAIPVATRAKGPGGAHEFTFSQLVNIGVLDELAALGAWRALRQPVEVETYFDPDPEEADTYNRLKPSQPEEEPPYYFRHMDYRCRVIVDILHLRTPEVGLLRLKRSPRIYRIQYQPDPHLYAGQSVLGSEKFEVTDPPIIVLASASINVCRIADHCQEALGLTQRPPG